MQRALWQLVRRDELRLHPISPQEEERMQALMEEYRDTPMDLADASLVAAAEALNQTRIFTTDTDFYVYQIGGRKPFEVVP